MENHDNKKHNLRFIRISDILILRLQRIGNLIIARNISWSDFSEPGKTCVSWLIIKSTTHWSHHLHRNNPLVNIEKRVMKAFVGFHTWTIPPFSDELETHNTSESTYWVSNPSFSTGCGHAAHPTTKISEKFHCALKLTEVMRVERTRGWKSLSKACSWWTVQLCGSRTECSILNLKTNWVT